MKKEQASAGIDHVLDCLDRNSVDAEAFRLMKLFDAAPELLAVLKTMLHENNSRGSHYSQTLDAAHAIIASAEGRVE